MIDNAHNIILMIEKYMFVALLLDVTNNTITNF